MYLIPSRPNVQHFSKTVCEQTNKRRQLWLSNIGCTEEPAAKACICQHHFVKGNIIKTNAHTCCLTAYFLLLMFVGKPSKPTATDDVDWIPTLLLPTSNILQSCTSQNGMR